jgi:hypothetical protein
MIMMLPKPIPSLLRPLELPLVVPVVGIDFGYNTFAASSGADFTSFYNATS